MTSAAKVPAAVGMHPHENRPRKRVRMGFAYQLWAMFSVFVYGALLLALTTAFVWVPLNRRVAADPSPVVQALLAAELFRVELWLAPLLLLCGSVAAVVALIRARRDAVAIATLQENLTRLAIGESDAVTFAGAKEFRALEAPLSGVGKRIEQLTRRNLEMLRVLRHNLEGLSQRAGQGNAELRESIAVLIRDVDTEIKKLQLKQ